MTIDEFLQQATPRAWIEAALADQPTLLLDHANCEKKAASTALSFLYRYPQYPKLVYRMSRLAREELRHFEKVLALMAARDISYQHLSPARYASALHRAASTHEPARLIDQLIIGAFIEARSCERFAQLAPQLNDPELASFYRGLLAAEERHFHQYLQLAQEISSSDIDSRIQYFREIENELIISEDEEFRFHSGIPKE